MAPAETKAEQEPSPPLDSKTAVLDQSGATATDTPASTDAKPSTEPSMASSETQAAHSAEQVESAKQPVSGLGSSQPPTTAPEQQQPAPVVQQPDPSTPMESDPSASKPPQSAAAAETAATKDEKSSVTRHTPILFPTAQCHPAAHKALTADQQVKYDHLLKTVSSWTEVTKPGSKGGPDAAITDSERLWLTRECLLRYLRATKWNEAEAVKRLMGTLVWRREYGLAGFTADSISPENETGKQVILGFDNDARPCLYLNPSRQNTENSPRQIQHLVYMLEMTIDILPPGQENLTLLIDFNATKSKTSPSVSTGRTVMSILQNQYPERLGRAVVINIPWFVSVFLKLIGPFIDPVTREKLRFNEPMADHVPTEQLVREMGGQLDFEYVHAVYWPAVNQLAAQRRAEMVRRWEKAGKRVGESEAYLRGGKDAVSVGVAIEQAENKNVLAEKTNGAMVGGDEVAEMSKLKV